MNKPSYFDMWVFIPVGGKGSRLMPFTLNRGKPLVPLFNHFPICEIIIYQLAKLGFRKYIFGVRGTDHYHQLNDYFQGGYGFSAGLGIKPQIEFEYQNPNYKDNGSADSCLYNLKRLGINKPILVVMGDNLFDSGEVKGFIESGLSCRQPFSVALQNTDTPEYFGIAELANNNTITRFIEKPNKDKTPSRLANCAIYLIRPEAFDLLEGDFGKNTLPKLAQKKLLYGHIITGWLNLDTPAQHLSVFQHLTKQTSLIDSFLNQTYSLFRYKGNNIWLRGKSRYSTARNKYITGLIKSNRLSVSGTVLIGRDCQIGTDCRFENCSIGDMTTVDDLSAIINSNILDAWSIGENTNITNSFLGRGGQIGDGSTVTDSFLADNVFVTSKSYILNQTLPNTQTTL